MIDFFRRYVTMWDEEISEGAHVGDHNPLGGPGVPRWIAHLVHLPLVLFAPKILKYSKNNRVNFLGHSENFYFGSFFIALEIQKTEKT